MLDPEWSHAALELLSMLFIAGGFIWAIKADTRVLAQRLRNLENRLDKMDAVLEKLSDQKSRIDVIDERMLAQGKRLDEATKLIAQVAMRYDTVPRP